jgi:hypothetical protein
MAIRKEPEMVQVKIEIEYNVDLGNAALLPAAFQGRVVLNTAHGARHQLFDFTGSGDIAKAQGIAMDWVNDNMLEHANASCRQLKYLKVAEQ